MNRNHINFNNALFLIFYLVIKIIEQMQHSFTIFHKILIYQI